MNYIFFSILGTVTVACHLFSLKLLSSHKQYFNEILIFAIVTMLLSRYFIYLGMSKTKNPTNVHLILNTSVFITLLLSLLILKIKDFNLTRYIIGAVVVLTGLYIVNTSCK